MNRFIALFLAMAILLAHMLAIHGDTAGNFAEPYDFSHVAYRMARNFVHTGSFSWGSGGHESYPSLLWVGIATVAERFYYPVTVFCQGVGAAASLSTVLVLARFSADRLVGVVAPLLLVTSGATAAAAASGNEIPLFALCLTAALLGYDQRRPTLLAASLGLACITRPEGILVTAAFLLLEFLAHVRKRGEPRSSLRFAFAVPITVWLATCLVRFSLTQQFFSPTLVGLASPDGERLHRGGEYLLDFFLASGAPLLIVFPIWYLLRGALSPTGRRALFLAFAWMIVVMLSGGGSLPMGNAMVPVLPALYVSVQEAMRLSFDSKRAWLGPPAWALFVLGILGSALASKYPGNLGLLPFETTHRRLMEPRAKPRFGYEQKLGRMGLAEEIDLTERLRSVGIFMRDHLDPSHTVLTPWPGAIGYLSRLRVIDVLGRTAPLPDQKHPFPWSGSPRADVRSALSTEPDYIVPQILFTEKAPTDQEIAGHWIRELDIMPDQPRRKLALRNQLISYELIAVPIADRPRRPGLGPTRPFYLMRKRSLMLSPRLRVDLEGRELVVSVQHRSHEQLADLRVYIEGPDGRIRSLSPSGEFSDEPMVLARKHLLLFPTGTRKIRLVTATLPEDVAGSILYVSLRNPGASGDHDFALASGEVVRLLK